MLTASLVNEHCFLACLEKKSSKAIGLTLAIRRIKSLDKHSISNALSLIKLFAALQVMYGHFVRHLNLPSLGIVSSAVGYFRGGCQYFLFSAVCLFGFL